MRSCWCLIALLLISAPALAADMKCGNPKRPCRPACSHRRDNSLLVAMKSGLDLSAGFRWQNEVPELACQTAAVPEPKHQPSRVVDPFYVGIGETLPLSPRSDLFAWFNRDFTDAPHWSASVGLRYHPFH